MGEFYKAPSINGVTIPYDASINELKKGLSEPMKYYVVYLRALAWKEDITSFNILKNELRNPDYYRRRAALENISYHKLWKDSTELVRELLLDHSDYVVKLALKLLNSDSNCKVDVINEVVLVSDFWNEHEEIIDECKNYLRKKQVDFDFIMNEYQNEKSKIREEQDLYKCTSQSLPINNWNENHKMMEYLNIIHRYFPDFTEEDAQILLYKLKNEGCGYASIVNTIMMYFRKKPYEFVQKFGFQMYDAYSNLNNDLLMLHFYCMTDEDGYGMTLGQIMARFKKFVKAHELNGKMDILLNVKKDQLDLPDTYIIIMTKNFILLDDKRKKHYMDTWHYMNLIQVDNDGNFLVSTWGNNYILRKADIMERVYYLKVRYYK